MIYQHFGHSKRINPNVYQAPPGSLQLQITGQLLLQILKKSKWKRKAVQTIESVIETKKTKIREAVTEPIPDLNIGVCKSSEFRKSRNVKKQGKCSNQKSGKP